ncbi:BCHE [Mytilus coruscus]|uniref:BCHE n=1 Tax=Mytilus coruscus TaxID=42192 RepID=A0A6J8B6G6_MYTCO|nr:BCHE [Mytilus coruscus]
MFIPCFLLVVFLVTNCTSVKTKIRTKIGIIEGFTQIVLGKRINTFLGIPFAEPPVGDLRFREPVPKRPWRGTRNTQKFAKSCSQPAFFTADIPAANQGEDCLYLNAWIPQGGCKRKHTMVWIVGGGFITENTVGSDPKVIAAFTDTIVFTISYRTGPLGFLYLDHKDAPGNMGLLDQSIAIKWIHKNVKRFGGSKDKITLFGNSAGGASVHYHILSEFSRPFFQKAIIQSGAADTKFSFHSPFEALNNANAFAAQLGCNKASVEETIRCLRSLPASLVSAIQIPPLPIPPLFVRAHLPTIDKIGFISRSPRELMKQPLPKHISVLLGVVKDEVSFFMAFYVNLLKIPIGINDGVITREEYFRFLPLLVAANNATSASIAGYYLRPFLPEEPQSYLDVAIDIGSDINFKCPVTEVAQTMSTVNPGNTVYMYSFEYRALFPPVPQWFGVLHASENDFVFGAPLIDSVNYSDTDRYVSERMMKYWTTFAKTGNPNFCQDTCNDWNRYDSRDRKYLIIDSDCPQDGQGLREKQCVFLKNVLAPVTWGRNPLSNTSFVAMTLTETDAKYQGFQKISDCGDSSGLHGIRYVKDNDMNLILIYDVKGHIAGISAAVPTNLANGWPHAFLKGHPFIKSGNHHHISAYFVDPAIICVCGRSTAIYHQQGVGTDLYIQNGTDPIADSMKIPHLQSGITSTHWTKGKCFPTMGGTVRKVFQNRIYFHHLIRAPLLVQHKKRYEL